MIRQKQLFSLAPVQPLGLALAGIVSFLAAGATIGGVASPLAVAAAGAMPPVYSVAVLAGGLLAYLVSGMDTSAAVVLCSLVLTVLLRFAWTEADRPRTAALTVGGSIVLSALCFFLLGMQDLAGLVLYLFLGAFSAVCTFFCADVRALWQRGEPFSPEGGRGAACAVVYLLLVAVLTPISLSFLRPGLLFAAFAVLTAADRYRAQGGLLCGALTSAGLLLCDAPIGGRAVLLGLGGLAAGYFADLGKGAMLGIFLVGNAVAQLLLGMNPSGYLFLGNLAIGGLIYLFVPTGRLAEALLPAQQIPADSTSLAAVRMRFLADSLAGVRENAAQVAQMLARSNTAPAAATQVSEAVCARCARRLNCWDDAFSDTQAAFHRLAEQPAVSSAELTAVLPDCPHAAELAAAFAGSFRQRAAERVRAAQLLETRQLLFAQMALTEEILRAAGERLELRFCAAQTRTVTQALEADGVPVHTAMAYFSPAHRLMVELYADADSPIRTDELCRLLSDALGREMVCAEAADAGKARRICLWERPRFSFCCYGTQSAADPAQPCGDRYLEFPDGQGNTYLVLSDGMGSGRQAALDSKIVISNFRRLILTGVAWRTALTMVNAIMLTKSGEERFATLDCVRLDGETGEATLLKSGASPTLVWHDGRLVCYQSPTAPLGIVPRTEPYVRTLPLMAGDVVVLISDGVDPALYPAFRQLLAGGCTLEKAAEQLCEMAQRVGAAAPDDVTVLLSYVQEYNKTC